MGEPRHEARPGDRYGHLRRGLRQEASEWRVRRMWSHIGAAPKRPRSGWFAGRVAVFGIAAVAAAVAFGWLARPADPGLSGPARGEVGPLSRASGAALPWQLRSGPRAERVALSDGSKLHLERGTHLETVINSDRSFEAVLHRGVVRFEVEPGGPRQWRIHAGAFDVQVVGTVFTVRRGARTSSVRVERGEVIVRGRAVPDGVKRLTAGDRFPSTTATASREIKARPSEPKRGEDEPRPSTTRAEPGSPKARDLQPDRISEAAGDDSVATLLRRADAARLSGHPERAVAPLQRILDAHPAHPHAGLAAFTLGRLQLTALRQPAQAAESLRRALELGVPEPLRESVRARRVQALARAHDGRADAAAQAYLDDFPEGRYRSEVGQWLAEP